MIRSAVLFAVFAFAIPLYAQQKPLPDAPKPKQQFSRKVYVAGVSLLAAAQTADAITTRRNLNLPGGSENNPVYGRHPSPARQAGINLAFFAGESAVFYLTEHNRHSWIRWAGRAFLGYSITDHAHAAACNAGLSPSTPGSCGSLVGFYWF
jgi:hypothetical protein